MLERAAERSGDAHHIAEGGEDYVRVLRDRQAIVNSPHGEHANRATGAVDEFNVLGKYVLQTEAIDSMRVTATHFHQPVVAVGACQSADFLSCSRNQFRFAKFIHDEGVKWGKIILTVGMQID